MADLNDSHQWAVHSHTRCSV